MVDFATEMPVDVREVTQRFKVTHDTVYRWFKRGLEHAKVGGKVVTSWQAFNRFSRQSVSGRTAAAPVLIDKDTADALKELRDRFGFRFSPEGGRDVQTKTKTR